MLKFERCWRESQVKLRLWRQCQAEYFEEGKKNKTKLDTRRNT